MVLVTLWVSLGESAARLTKIVFGPAYVSRLLFVRQSLLILEGQFITAKMILVPVMVLVGALV